MKLEDLGKYLIMKENTGNVYEIIITILVIYNCRINEILKARWGNFHPEKFLILEGSKGSANIIIHDREILKSIKALPKSDQDFIFPWITYYQIYHEIKKKYSHLLNKISHRKNMKITHSFRYLNVSGIDNDKFIKDILHHNSTRSGKYYKNKLKGS